MASLGAEVPEGNARKRLKMSRNGKASPSPSIAASASNTFTPAPPPTTSMNGGESSKAHVHDGTCHHEAALQTLHADVDAMRGLITCQVCHRFMYEPYALSCGHTYCYACLTHWLGSNGKKTCPECRAVITQQPTPSYIIREMVLIFSSRTQLLPDGETSEEHATNAKEEAELVARDKASTDPATGGLFNGSFRHGGRMRLLPIRDPGDNVDRCPHCHWEVEDGYCNQCGVPVGGDDSDFDDLSDGSVDTNGELDRDIDEYDGDGAAFGADDLGLVAEHPISIDEYYDEDEDMDAGVFNQAFNRPPLQVRPGPARGRHHVTISVDTDESDEEEDEDEHDPEMDNFIDYDDASARGYAFMNETEDDEEEDDTVQEVSQRPARRRGHAQVVISDDDDDEGTLMQEPQDVVNLESSDDEAPVLSNSRRVKRNRAPPRSRAIAISSDEESEEESEPEQQQHQTESVTGIDSVAGGFSSLDENSDEEPAVSVHYNHSDAESDASHNFGYIDHEAEEEESDDDDGSEGSEGNGYGASSAQPSGHHTENDVLTTLAATRASLPPFKQNYVNRLQTNQPRRSRFFDAPAPAPAARRAIDWRNRRSSFIEPAPYHAAREPSLSVPAAAYPFVLSNTLANINARQRSLAPSANAMRSRSGNASSQNSPAGSVQVLSSGAPTSSSSSGSSNGSSQTIKWSDSCSNRPISLGARRVREFASAARGRRNIESFARSNPPSISETDEDDEDDDDEY